MQPEIERARAELHATARRTVERRAEEIARAAANDVPIGDPAEDPRPDIALRDRWRVEVLDSPLGVRARIWFDTDYATKIHENMRLDHPRGGKPKFLSDEIKLEMASLEGHLAEGARGVL